jgi:hypothetical protein
MKRTLPGRAALLAALFALVAAVQAADIRQETVRFPAGAAETTLKGRVQGDRTVDYRVRASAGQTLSVRMQETNPQNYFNVLPPGSKGEAMFVGQDGGDFRGMVPADGDYTVRVYLMRAAARRNETSDYTLTVAVTGKALAPLAASKDALIPGTRFHASSTLPCTPPFATAASTCDAFVTRRGFDGTGTVEVRSQGRTVRRVLFVEGKPAASDAMAEMTSVREGDGTVVRFGRDERYVVPDAFLRGG